MRISFLKLDPQILPDMGVKVSFLADEKPCRQGARSESLYSQIGGAERCGKLICFSGARWKVEHRAVRLGADRGNDVAVMAGVTPGDSLVVTGPTTLHDGDKVEIKR